MVRRLYTHIQKRTYEIVEQGRDDDKKSRMFDFFIMLLVMANVLAVILETVPSMKVEHRELFAAFELFSVAVFSLEILARIWSCVSVDTSTGPLKKRIKELFRPLVVIDLLAVLPFYLSFAVVDLRVLRVLRLLRLLRIAKFGRYSDSLKCIFNVVDKKKDELLITVGAMLLLLIVASTLVFYVEHEAQPDAFSSIPATMWWGVCTLTTVGYGDLYPVTLIGKLLASVISILGVGMFALPAGILASGFEKAFSGEDPSDNKTQEPQKCFCPYCGENLQK